MEEKTFAPCCEAPELRVIETLVHDASFEDGTLFVHTSTAQGGFDLIVCNACGKDTIAEGITNIEC